MLKNKRGFFTRTRGEAEDCEVVRKEHSVSGMRDAMQLSADDSQDARTSGRRLVAQHKTFRAAASRFPCTPLSAVALLFAAACGGGLQPAPSPTPAPPPPIPVAPTVIEPTVERWTTPPALTSSRYINEVNTTLERDSAGRVLTEHVLARGVITLQGRRDTVGGFRGTGSVDSFTVRGLERVLSPGAGETSSTPVPVLTTPALSVNFDATLDARILRVATRPALANECDRAEVGATNLVRDVMVRLPRTLAIGQTWQDSTIGFQCRLGVPITSRTKNSYVIERADKVQDRTELVVRKSSDTQMTGEIKSTWRVMTVNATGRSTQVIRVDAATGIMRAADSDGQLTVKLNDTSRRDGSGVQEVRQTTRGRVTFLR